MKNISRNDSEDKWFNIVVGIAVSVCIGLMIMGLVIASNAGK